MDAVRLPLPSVQVQCLASNPPDRDGLCPGWAQPQNHGAGRPRRQLSASLLGTDRAGLSSTVEEDDRAGKAAALRASLALALGQLLTSPGAWAPGCSSGTRLSRTTRRPVRVEDDPQSPTALPWLGFGKPRLLPWPLRGVSPTRKTPGLAFGAAGFPTAQGTSLAARAPSAQETLNGRSRSQPLKVYGDGNEALFIYKG